MMQHLILTHNDKRVVVILEFTSQEYGVSEQSFWSCWVAHQKHHCGDGATLEAAVQDMIRNIEYREEMWKVSQELIKNIRAAFQESNVGTVGIRCPVVQNG